MGELCVSWARVSRRDCWQNRSAKIVRDSSCSGILLYKDMVNNRIDRCLMRAYVCGRSDRGQKGVGDVVIQYHSTFSTRPNVGDVVIQHHEVSPVDSRSATAEDAARQKEAMRSKGHQRFRALPSGHKHIQMFLRIRSKGRCAERCCDYTGVGSRL